MSFNETQGCYRELADLILQNRNLKSLSLKQEGMSDQSAAFLIEPLVRSLNIENLRLDENQLTSVWLEKLCKRISLVGFNTLSHSGSTGLKSNPS
jgi:Leucine-rich repeat (LRR) protein